MEQHDKRVLLVDDHPLFRIGMRTALTGLGIGVAVHEAGSVLEALDALAAQPRFNLIVYDWRLNQGDGRRMGLIAISQSAPGVPLMVLSAVEDEDVRHAALDSGAIDFVLKTTEPRRLCSLILRNLQRPPPHAASPTAGAAAAAVRAAPPVLTARQRDVLNGMARGDENKCIADELGIGEATVRGHVSDILRLLSARNRTQAVVTAARLGLI